MFYGCSSLKLLDIRNFNTKNIKSIDCYLDIFKGISNSNSFTLIYNNENTKEISDEINQKWNNIIIN